LLNVTWLWLGIAWLWLGIAWLWLGIAWLWLCITIGWLLGVGWGHEGLLLGSVDGCNRLDRSVLYNRSYGTNRTIVVQKLTLFVVSLHDRQEVESESSVDCDIDNAVDKQDTGSAGSSCTVNSDDVAIVIDKVNCCKTEVNVNAEHGRQTEVYCPVPIVLIQIVSGMGRVVMVCHLAERDERRQQ